MDHAGQKLLVHGHFFFGNADLILQSLLRVILDDVLQISLEILLLTSFALGGLLDHLRVQLGFLHDLFIGLLQVSTALLGF